MHRSQIKFPDYKRFMEGTFAELHFVKIESHSFRDFYNNDSWPKNTHSHILRPYKSQYLLDFTMLNLFQILF